MSWGGGSLFFRIAITVEMVLGVLVVLLLVGETLATRRRARRRPTVDRARAAVVAAMQDPAATDEAVERLRALRRWDALPMVVRLAGTVMGESLDRLRDVAERAGLTAHARDLCAHRQWDRRLRGLRVLSRLDADRAGIVGRLLRDPVPVVRSAAAESSGWHPPPDVVAGLLDLLDDPDPECRFAARVALADGSPPVREGLLAYLEQHDPPRVADALEVGAAIADPRLLPAGLRHAASPDPAVRVQAARLLGALAAPEAGTLLREQVATDPSPGVRAAAVGALGRLHRYADGRALEDALADEDLGVRREAALSLLALGPAGRLHLRRAARRGAGPGADAARHVLELPRGAAEMVGR